MQTSGDAVNVLYVGERPKLVESSDDAGNADGVSATTADGKETGLRMLSSRPFDCVVGDVAEPSTQ